MKIVEPFEQQQQPQPQPPQLLQQESVESEQSAQTTPEKEKENSRIKKSVTFDTTDEKIQKFITGEPIVDQRNPFKHVLKEKKTPPPVPTKRSTLSIRKTVTQQLREREREKEKEREREKNESNLRKQQKQPQSQSQPQVNGGSTSSPADEFITTEEVLKQSKYVKTYIKNPDAYFVYDPTVLARLKFEELRDIAAKVPPKRKQTANSQIPNRVKETKQLKQEEATKPKQITYKKCSKPNYPELAHLKIKTGTEHTGDYFNAAEVTKNAKKFDERVKKLQISSDDDLDEIDGPLTKSESSDELNTHSSESEPLSMEQSTRPSAERTVQKTNKMGTFTNTISSDEFQAYLERKGLTLMPKQLLTPTVTPTPSPTIAGRESAEERRRLVTESLAALRKSNSKKLTVLQRLSNSLFAPKRKSTPKVSALETMERKGSAPSDLRRIRLEPATPVTTTTTPLQRNSLERQSLIPRRVTATPEGSNASFSRSASMDRQQIKALRQPISRLESVGQRRSLATSMPIASSTPKRKEQASPLQQQQQQQQQQNHQQQQQQEPQQQWEQLRAIKEVTDRQLYNKVMQQQQQQQQEQQAQQLLQSVENIYEHLPGQPCFVRGTLQRNTFNGFGNARNRQFMIVDGAPIAPQQQQLRLQQQQQQQLLQTQQLQQFPPQRCQSALDEPITPNSQRLTLRRGYESENETPVVLRRKETPAARRIGGLLTREEILEKVKEFCRKSISRTPLANSKMQPIYERHQHNDISPVSYASVETHKRPASQLSMRPQLPQRVQSLSRNGSAYAPSPIYAHVNKRSSLLSNDSEAFGQPASEYVLIQTEDGIQAAKLLDLNQSALYMPQPQYVRAPQGYQMQNNRATPLIFDRSSQQSSQIYWTPQHQRLHQSQLNLMALQQSSPGRVYPVPAPRANVAHSYVLANGQQYATVVPAPRNLTLLQQQQHHNRLQMARNSSDWDCSSEAGEVRRIMEKSL
ncbi:CG42353 [Drosophila busckii]|uniref:CG42353 n=1 Tax=Drosophila busckii TaxID=30019 RepID=A0A0M4EVG7_DROBS|nr:CG42353 [Drosophila busckii]